MVKRKHIALIFSYNENWIGGTYYIYNLIHALKTLDDSKRPEITILAPDSESYNKVKQETKYPYLSYAPYIKSYSFFQRVVNKLSRIFSGKSICTIKIEGNFDCVFPNPNIAFSIKGQKVHWIPDFQDEYLPEFFSEKEVLSKKEKRVNLSKNLETVVFSSEDALNHYVKNYSPIEGKLMLSLPFAVTLPDYSHENMEDLKRKYSLPKKYFICPNQFWEHKNHLVVLKAIRHMKFKKGIDIHVVFTGKEYDSRNPDYFFQLKNFVTDHTIEDNISFLGFIERTHMLKIMDSAIAVIQPSLFEGWSTVIEDAKAIGKNIIASDIAVHEEQLQAGGEFFSPHDHERLSFLLNKYWDKSFPHNDIDYNENISVFAQKIMGII